MTNDDQLFGAYNRWQRIGVLASFDCMLKGTQTSEVRYTISNQGII